ncbi:hypothetical protein COU16_00950 [Candidatus Kaiserbacteria bacterium CG10_big_fil_rev_8_21_14_0_10_47_16]|uniref:Uncharacterized protein n=1 Tax=Candidatus Kaiserbacteria bacterium CG10_big_fil_rev_8_21_14_0_10_47_16 TaxID=1974608 RepID=A0A2H0UE82_9BACT|nr:MAG: hypothetical protein COU16_00950 [Candidatus Kaiserbacteria bacterium CG10_big_fil_rev_8_21_14_0_10_47_16]
MIGVGMVTLSLPLTSLAATYFYVDTSGEVQTVEASDSTEALTLSAHDRAVHSGVAIDRGVINEGDVVLSVALGTSTDIGSGPYVYQYVNTNGTLSSVSASSADMALSLSAYNRASNSGVMLVRGMGGSVENTTYPTGTLFTYQYIDVNGNLRSIEAANASLAITLATNRDPHSGVVFVK